MTAAREQRTLENLEAWASRNEWARRTASRHAMRLIPDRLHPAYQSVCCRKFTRERIK